nr:protease modulator HflC [Thiolinea sp.]
NLNANSERFLTGEKKYVLVDFFVKWQIQDVGTYYRATSGIQLNAERRLEDIMKDGLRNEFSRRTIEEALSDQRDDIMQGLEVKSNEIASQLGINIVDVRVSKIDFPEQVSESVFARMRSERERVAQDFRSRGKEESEKIRAAADREATVIMAEAYRESETIRGAGDAKAAETYARAYQQDVEFYSFYRSLSAYRNTLGKPGDMLVLEPDSEFFRYFGNMNATSGRPALAAVPVPAAMPEPPVPMAAKPAPAAASATGAASTAKPATTIAAPAQPATVTPAQRRPAAASTTVPVIAPPLPVVPAAAVTGNTSTAPVIVPPLPPVSVSLPAESNPR